VGPCARLHPEQRRCSSRAELLPPRPNRRVREAGVRSRRWRLASDAMQESARHDGREGPPRAASEFLFKKETDPRADLRIRAIQQALGQRPRSTARRRSAGSHRRSPVIIATGSVRHGAASQKKRGRRSSNGGPQSPRAKTESAEWTEVPASGLVVDRRRAAIRTRLGLVVVALGSKVDGARVPRTASCQAWEAEIAAEALSRCSKGSRASSPPGGCASTGPPKEKGARSASSKCRCAEARQSATASLLAVGRKATTAKGLGLDTIGLGARRARPRAGSTSTSRRSCAGAVHAIGRRDRAGTIGLAQTRGREGRAFSA